jgi:hypothetical protein
MSTFNYVPEKLMILIVNDLAVKGERGKTKYSLLKLPRLVSPLEISLNMRCL